MYNSEEHPSSKRARNRQEKREKKKRRRKFDPPMEKIYSSPRVCTPGLKIGGVDSVVTFPKIPRKNPASVKTLVSRIVNSNGGGGGRKIHAIPTTLVINVKERKEGRYKVWKDGATFFFVSRINCISFSTHVRDISIKISGPMERGTR